VAPALVVSLALQVGVNYANDYSDGVKGTDSDRVGPMRLVGSGAASPGAVKRAALLALGVAAAAGLLLAAVTTWWLLAVGVAALVAAWTYTGGPRPYGYAGWGEVFVFVFFGVVATCGTTFVVAEKITAVSMAVSVGVGSLACALLVTNNLRDIPTDRLADKRTLAVRIGDDATRALFVGLLAAAAAATVVTSLFSSPEVLAGLAGLVVSVPAVRLVRMGASGRDLVGVLEIVGRAQLAYGASVSLGIALALS
jgi:1,4-dihydroxy-2-naphthoate octaprenyltransferase